MLFKGAIVSCRLEWSDAKAHGITGPDAEIKKMLNSYDGSVEAAAKILKDYVTEFREMINWGKDL